MEYVQTHARLELLGVLLGYVLSQIMVSCGLSGDLSPQRFNETWMKPWWYNFSSRRVFWPQADSKC
ncbi:hypothetical protein BYT27DRAFT_6739980 [Phlegmacium glaucopus]|nr:hypothetical protein BYT27DRAFT_6739980 [Phlegmacium glaucopus]